MATMVLEVKKKAQKPTVKKVIKKAVKKIVQKVMSQEEEKIITSLELIEKKAYELYEKRGCADGFALQDWLEAEKLLEAGE